MKQPKLLQSLLVKPAGPDCNLRCQYCFYLEKADYFHKQKIHRMSDEILEEMIRQGLEQCTEGLSIGWQGGEPSLMGLDFYKKAIQFQMQYGRGQYMSNGFQTNGLLMNKDWADFFRQYHFLIGLSLDGPQHIHDHFRLDMGGRGSHQRVEDAAKLLLDAGVDTNAMTCVTSYSVNYPDEIYEYHKSLGLRHMQFIPIIEEDPRSPGKLMPFSVSAEDFGDFLCRIFDLWLADFKDGRSTTYVRHMDSGFFPYAGHGHPDCSFMKTCGTYLVVEHNGEIYSCDFFVDKANKLGKIPQDRLIDLLNSKKQQLFGEKKALLPPDCKKCPWKALCYGGCPKNRIVGADNKQKITRLCQAYKKFYKHSDPVYKELARNFNQG